MRRFALRPYQLEALAAVESAETRGTRRQFLAVPTVCGKTVIFPELGAAALIDREAAWRRAPASDKQLDTLRRCRMPVAPGLTKGAAADLLTATFARSRR